jgi:hypothetical protein
MTSPLSTSGNVSLGSIIVVDNGNGNDCIVISSTDGNGTTQYAGAVTTCASLNPSATSEFTNLAGTASSWTKLPTLTQAGGNSAAYGFTTRVGQYGTSGHLFAVVSPNGLGDRSDYGTDVRGYYLDASGATWSVRAGYETLSSDSYESFAGDGCTDSSGNLYFPVSNRALDSGTGNIYISRVSSSGTFTASIDPALDPTVEAGEVSLFFNVTSDGTHIVVVTPFDYGTTTAATRNLAYVLDGSTWRKYELNHTGRSGTIIWSAYGSQGWADGIAFLTTDNTISGNPAQLGSIHVNDALSGVRYENYTPPTYSTSGGTSIAITYDGGIPSANDQFVWIIGQKPSTANSGTITYPAGWTTRATRAAAGGYSSTLGADTGNTNIKAATKDTVTGSESGSISATLATNNVSWSVLVRASRSGSGAWDIAGTDGADETTGAALSVTFGANPGITAGDLIVVAWCMPTDVTTPNQFTAQTLTCAGVTFEPLVELAEPDSTTGNDIGGAVWVTRAISGTSTGAPILAATASGTTTNVRGGAVLVRLRSATSSDISGAAAESQTHAADAGNGDVAVTGAVAQATGTQTEAVAGDTIVRGSSVQATGKQTESGNSVYVTSLRNGSALGLGPIGNSAICDIGVVTDNNQISATCSEPHAVQTELGNGDVIIDGGATQTAHAATEFALGGPRITGAASQVQTRHETSVQGRARVTGTALQSQLKHTESAAAGARVSGTAAQTAAVATEATAGDLQIHATSAQQASHHAELGNTTDVRSGGSVEGATHASESAAATLRVSGLATEAHAISSESAAGDVRIGAYCSQLAAAQTEASAADVLVGAAASQAARAATEAAAGDLQIHAASAQGSAAQSEAVSLIHHDTGSLLAALVEVHSSSSESARAVSMAIPCIVASESSAQLSIEVEIE